MDLNFMKLLEMALTGSLMDEVPNLMHGAPYKFEIRENGQDWPTAGHTMVGHKRLRNVREALMRVVRDGIPGGFAELGVWRGGTCIYSRAVLNLLKNREQSSEVRMVYMFDVFGEMIDYGRAKEKLAVSINQVKHNFDKYGLTDGTGNIPGVQFIRGLFNETVFKFYFKNTDPQGIPLIRIAVLRLDGNFYRSHEDSLYAMWDFVPTHGIVIFDDGFHPHVQRFWKDFCHDQGIDARIMQRIDYNGGSWFVKPPNKERIDKSKKRLNNFPSRKSA